jgi:membrane protease YdiL (CAAX protease family)
LRAVPWRGIDVLAVLFADQLFIPALVLLCMFGNSIDKDHPLSERQKHWLVLVAFPFQVAVIPLLLRMFSGTQLYQLGITGWRWRQNVVLGYLGWLCVVPVVLLVEFAADQVSSMFMKSESHALTQFLYKGDLAWSDWLMFFGLALAAAPIGEELLFRGVLQTWFMRRSWGADAALAGAFVMALLNRTADLETAMRASGGERTGAIIRALLPALFILAMIPGYIYSEVLAWRWLPEPGAARTIYATSLLFAACHSAVWPSPVPLFPLALGLGYLAYRTQSLVPSMVMHFLFNAIACITLVLLRALRIEVPL